PAVPAASRVVLGAPVLPDPTVFLPEVQGGDAACAQEPSVGWDGPCPPAGRLWVGGEYLLWWIRDSHLPPLVTASPPASGGSRGRAGAGGLRRRPREKRGAPGAPFRRGFRAGPPAALRAGGRLLLPGVALGQLPRGRPGRRPRRDRPPVLQRDHGGRGRGA